MWIDIHVTVSAATRDTSVGRQYTVCVCAEEPKALFVTKTKLEFNLILIVIIAAA